MNLNKSDDNNKLNLTFLMGKLRNEDQNYSNLCKVLKVIYWVLIPIYALLTIVTYIDTKEINDIYAGLALISCFVVFIVLMESYQKEYKNADYSLPTLEMLKKAAGRYHFIRPKAVWAIVGLLLMDLGFSLTSRNSVDFLTFQMYAGIFMLIALFIGMIVWYVKYKPIRDNVLAIIAEIEGE